MTSQGRTGAAFVYGPISLPIDGDDNTEVPSNYRLAPAFPNPFTTRTVLFLSLGKTEHVEVTVLDILGRRRSTIYDGIIASGDTKKIVVQGSDLSPGTYFVHVQSESFAETRVVFRLK